MKPNHREPLRSCQHRRTARRSTGNAAILGVFLLASPNISPALASFHFMQIEQVIGRINEDATIQAIQLRMRSNGQERVSGARLIAWDAAGENPVVLIDFTSDVASGVIGDRILVVSDSFARRSDPTVVPDFIFTNLIPKAYLAAGSITFENGDGTLLVWRLSWGGDAYVGPTSGALTNDDDGDFAPNYPEPFPADGLVALLFQGSADAQSTSNADDYVPTVGPVTLTNNAGEAFEVADVARPEEPEDSVGGDSTDVPDMDSDDTAESDDGSDGESTEQPPVSEDDSESTDVEVEEEEVEVEVDEEPDDSGAVQNGSNDHGSQQDENAGSVSNTDAAADANQGATSTPIALCGLGMIPFLPTLFATLLCAKLIRKGQRVAT